MTIEATVATQVHGRYLRRPAGAGAVLVGFHGYGESADTQFERLLAIPGADAWTVISIQGLHRFYERRTDRVVASWMTRQDREFAISDNIAYVANVLEHALPDRSAVRAIVFAGFSQGVAMAFRAAVTTPGATCHVVAVGGDVPPELAPDDLRRLGSVLLCRGADDPWYGPDTFERDTARLQAAGTKLSAVAVAGGHEWSQGVIDAAAALLKRMATQS